MYKVAPRYIFNKKIGLIVLGNHTKKWGMTSTPEKKRHIKK